MWEILTNILFTKCLNEKLIKFIDGENQSQPQFQGCDYVLFIFYLLMNETVQ